MDKEQLRKELLDNLTEAAELANDLLPPGDKDNFLESIETFSNVIKDDETVEGVINSMAWAFNIGYLLGAGKNPEIIVLADGVYDLDAEDEEDERIH